MLKLITVDIKVLGHRIWAIPVGVFLLVMMFSFIPYLNQVQSFQNWIFAILIPGLLTFELFREEQKSGMDKMLMTMPVSKEKYVWGKYIVIICFTLLGFLVGETAYKLIEIFDLSVVDSFDVRYFNGMYYSSFTVLKLLFIVVPIYLFSKKLKMSFILAPIIMFGLMYFYISVFITLRYQALYAYSLGFIGYYINLMLLIIIVLFIHTIIIYKFKKFIPKLMHLWFVVIILIFIMTNDILKEQISMPNHYYRMKKISIEKAEVWKEITMEKYSWGSKHANFLEYAKRYCEKEEYKFIVSFLVTVITSLLLLILHKSNKNKFTHLIILFFLMPVILHLCEEYIVFFLGTFMKEYRYYYPDMPGAPLYFYSLTIGAIIYLFYSAKSSIYLLKNNRTLK